MAAIDAQAEILGWVLDEAGKQCLGQDYRCSVIWVQVPQQGPGGSITVMAGWALLITGQSPLLKPKYLSHTAELGLTQPDEEDVRRIVREALMALRALRAQLLSAGNGKALAK
jgi:hypothetical protein